MKIKTIEQERIDFLIPILRKASVRWKYRLIAKEKAKRKSQSDNKKLKWEYQDAIDGTWHPGTNIQLDHRVPISTFLDFNTFIEKLFCDDSNYQVLSKENHAKKTAEESSLRAEVKNQKRKMKKITNEQLLDETIEYYKTHPRGRGADSICQYLTEDKAMCAIGRCLKEKSFKHKYIKENIRYVAEGSYLNKEVLDTLVKEEYQEITIWAGLQNLHDRDYYWKVNQNGGQDLSEKGLEIVESLRKSCQSF